MTVPTWDTSCRDWRERLRAGRSIIPPPIFPEQAALALEVFKSLRVVDVPGSPTFGECCAQWVFDFVASVFGAYDEKSGRRLITEWFLCVSKKNTKSTIAAGVMKTALIRNWRQSAEFTILAPTVEVANNSFSPARDMTMRDPDLSKLMLVQTHIKTITHRVTNSSLKVVAADSNTVSGKKSVGTLVDELWQFGTQANAENMLREATGGLASRPEGFVLYLTTQSDDAPAGVFKSKLDYARRVRDGEIHDPRFVPIIYEFDEVALREKQYLDRRFWKITNPNLGFSVDEAFIERELKKAQIGGSASLAGFLAKHLNVEIGLSLRADRWPGADFWEETGKPPLPLDEVLRRSDVTTIGVDGGGMKDLMSLAVVGRDSRSGEWLHWQHSWVHSRALTEFHLGAAQRLRDFESSGDLTIVDALPDDVSGLVQFVKVVYDSGTLHKLGIDPAQAGVVLDALMAAGIPEEMVVGISQGWRLMGAIIALERRLVEGRFRHGSSPLMAWAVSNAKVEQRGNAILVTKEASGAGKIDPLMATFNAAELMAKNPESMRSFWEATA